MGFGIGVRGRASKTIRKATVSVLEALPLTPVLNYIYYSQLFSIVPTPKRSIRSL
jgi:hypothetical protein